MIIDPHNYDRWLAPDVFDAEELNQMILPYPWEKMQIPPS